jgi:hypothetical protein
VSPAALPVGWRANPEVTATISLVSPRGTAKAAARQHARASNPAHVAAPHREPNLAEYVDQRDDGTRASWFAPDGP